MTEIKMIFILVGTKKKMSVTLNKALQRCGSETSKTSKYNFTKSCKDLTIMTSPQNKTLQSLAET